MMKERRLQACSLRHSIKKGMLSVWGKLDLFKSGMGGVLPPLPPLLGYAPVTKGLIYDNQQLLVKQELEKLLPTLLKLNFGMGVLL